VDVQRRKRAAGDRTLLELSRVDSRGGHLDHSRFGSLVLVRLAQRQHRIFVNAGPRRRIDCRANRFAWSSNGSIGVALRVRLVSFHANCFAFDDGAGFERERRASHPGRMGKCFCKLLEILAGNELACSRWPLGDRQGSFVGLADAQLDTACASERLTSCLSLKYGCLRTQRDQMPARKSLDQFTSQTHVSSLNV
jgi:hypothetical protein